MCIRAACRLSVCLWVDASETLPRGLGWSERQLFFSRMQLDNKINAKDRAGVLS